MSMCGYLMRVPQQQLESFCESSEGLLKVAYTPSEKLVDLDKAWCGIYYLLTDCPMEEFHEADEPLSWSFFSGQLLDEMQDLGYGPAHYALPEQVNAVHQALQEIPVEKLMEKYNAEEMNEYGLYPQGWELEESRDYIVHYYKLMRDFYAEAAAAGEAVIAYLS